MTWQKLSAIQAACDVELTFDRCLAMVKAAEAQVNSQMFDRSCASIIACEVYNNRGTHAVSLRHRLSHCAAADQQQNIC